MATQISRAQAKELLRAYVQDHPGAQLRNLDIAKVARELEMSVAVVTEAREALLADEHARLEQTRRTTNKMRAATEGVDPESGIKGGVPLGPWSVKNPLAAVVGRMRRSKQRDVSERKNITVQRGSAIDAVVAPKIGRAHV